MANGANKVVEKVQRILEDKGKMSTRTGLELSLALSAENHKLLEQVLSELNTVKRRSWGNWAHENPKMAIFMASVFVTIFISDFRHPVIEWLGGNIGILLSVFK